MSISKSEQSLDYVPIIGRGVDALEHRKEHNNNQPVSAKTLQTSIDRVKDSIFNGLRMLTTGALQRIQK
jgi:hypothetical protein